MKLRFLLAWGRYDAGAVIEPPAMLRDQLLAVRFYGRKIVEPVEEAQPAAEVKPEPRPAPAAGKRKAREAQRQP